MASSIFLASRDIPDLLSGSDPEEIAAAHPLWEESLRHWGPWRDGAVLADPDGAGGRDSLALTGWLAPWPGPGNIFLCRECSSALDVAWKLVKQRLFSEWDAVIAVTQWTGRGQVRRPWQSLPGNLHAVWRMPLLPKSWEGVTALVPAWLTAQVLASLGWDVRVKWPNDLVWNGQKIGGILIEQRGELVLAGLGLNLATVPDSTALRDGAALPIGSMGGRISPAMCWEQLVTESRCWYTNILPMIRPEDFAARFSEIILWKGQRVTILEHSPEGEVMQGIVQGIAPNGSLKLFVQDRTLSVTSGEVVRQERAPATRQEDRIS